MNLRSRVKLVEVGPRDGLQNEKLPVPAAVKIELVHLLQDAGLNFLVTTALIGASFGNCGSLSENMTLQMLTKRIAKARQQLDCHDFCESPEC